MIKGPQLWCFLWRRVLASTELLASHRIWWNLLRVASYIPSTGGERELPDTTRFDEVQRGGLSTRLLGEHPLVQAVMGAQVAVRVCSRTNVTVHRGCCPQ